MRHLERINPPVQSVEVFLYADDGTRLYLHLRDWGWRASAYGGDGSIVWDHVFTEPNRTPDTDADLILLGAFLEAEVTV